MALLKIGVAPTKRAFLSMEEAVRQKAMFMSAIRAVKPDKVELVTLDDVCENGILFRDSDAAAALDKFRKAEIDALFLPFCDFGEERTVAEVAGGLMVPTLLWGARDERASTAESRGRDTQCGMLAASKVLLRRGVRFSYLYGCSAGEPRFAEGFETFLRAAAAVKAVKGLRIAKIGQRPVSFLSVMTDEAQLLRRYGITTVPISISDAAARAIAIADGADADFEAYYRDVTARIDFSSIPEADARLQAALVFALRQLMLENSCAVGALECWSGFGALWSRFGRKSRVLPCLAVGELADMGLPLSCECDVNGAVTLSMLRAVTLGESAPFFADLTIRSPENDNAELLWHCGPFPYSLKAEGCRACMTGSNEHWELKKGELTICRFDDLDGKYYLFGGEGRAVDGPETTGTYVWLKTDDWQKWEEHLMFGPYIHHVGGVYGSYKRALREAARYLDAQFDDPDIPDTPFFSTSL